MTDFRGAVVQAAISQLGQHNLAEYWSDALGKPQQSAPKLAWCGIFALRCLHVAGLAQHVTWRMGVGFLSKGDGHWLIPMTDKPQPGDIGYRDKPWQHHFVVEAVDGDQVHSIDGNSGAYSTVNRCTHPVGHGCIYFSIAPLIALVGTQDPLPSPSVRPPVLPQPAAIQHALNSLMLAHPLEHSFGLLLIDGIAGPKTKAAVKWAQSLYHLTPTGDPNDQTLLQRLGLA
jgi:hypothetical protein